MTYECDFYLESIWSKMVIISLYIYSLIKFIGYILLQGKFLKNFENIAFVASFDHGENSFTLNEYAKKGTFDHENQFSIFPVLNKKY